jgi:hypothetical protein
MDHATSWELSATLHTWQPAAAAAACCAHQHAVNVRVVLQMVERQFSSIGAKQLLKNLPATLSYKWGYAWYVEPNCPMTSRCMPLQTLTRSAFTDSGLTPRQEQAGIHHASCSICHAACLELHRCDNRANAADPHSQLIKGRCV